MTGTIALTTQTTPSPRIGVQLTSWAAADGPIVVKRVHPDTSEWTVRGFGNTSGGQAFAWDYEAPFGQSVTYYAFDGATKVTSSSTTLAVTAPLLRGPGLPANDASFTLVAKPKLTRERPGAILRPLGRLTAVTLTASRFKPDFQITVETHSDQEATTLLNTWTQSQVCLLLIPGVRDSWQYVFISKMEETPFTEFLSSSNGDPGSWSQWTLTCTTTDAPVGGIFGDPTASYAAVVSNYATYAALKTAKATYLDVIKGVP